MVSINKSFLYGMFFASITWVVSLYLYIRLTYSDLKTTPGPGNFPVKSLNYIIHNNNNNDDDGDNKGDRSYKNLFWKRKDTSFVNSKDIIDKLKPVFNKPPAINGEDTELSDLGLVKTVEEQKIKEEGYKIHAYNTLISERLSLHRNLPDTRNKLCKTQQYPQSLPTASIIICFYNEHYQTLLRSLHSIIDRSPSELLEEIVLIDDYSDLPNLHQELDNYIKVNFNNKVKLYKTDQREGLIRARIIGAQKSNGEVIIFLDSHIEVNEKWLEPLLARIKENRTNVVMPIIDIINADTFIYTASPLVRGGFNWGLHFKWENLPKGTLTNKEDFIKPIKSPTMAGGLFAINRTYFIEMGQYDPGMNIWGGENLEISFRIWMCGGRLEMIPCSRVGHIFRQRRPYGAPNGEDTMLHNSLRVANVWMDSYKDYFLSQRSDAASIDFGDITSRLELRKQLKCYDFDWYLKNVYPELIFPTDNQEKSKKKLEALESDKFQPWHSRKRNYVNQYQIRLANSTLCLQSAKDFKTKGSNLMLKNCIRTKTQIWYETDRNELVLAQLLCLQASKMLPILYKCHEMGGDQEWKHKGMNHTPIYNLAAGTCLGAKKKKLHSPVVMKLCTELELITWDIIR